MGCFDTGKLSDSGTKNGSVTPVWGGRLMVWVRLCRANMMTVADAKRFVASRRARRSGIAAPLCHIWLPAAPLRQLASSYDHACKSSPALHRMHAWWNPDRVLGKSFFLWFFVLRQYQNQLYAGTFYRYRHCWIYGSRVHGTRCQHRWVTLGGPAEPPRSAAGGAFFGKSAIFDDILRQGVSII